MHPKNNSGGSLVSEHAESGGKSPLVSVKHSERGRLTSKWWLLTSLENLIRKVVHVKSFVVYGYLLHNNKNLCLFGMTQGAEEISYCFDFNTVLNVKTR